MAIFLAVRAGLRDAKAGKPAYLWSVFTVPSHRTELLHEGWKDVMRVFFLAVGLDFIFQLIQFKWIYPGESLVVAFGLAIVPYLIVRGPVNRIARRFKQPANPTSLLSSEEDVVVVDIDSSGRKPPTSEKPHEQQEPRIRRKG